MDPKEYIENLNALDQEENLLRRKFQIDFQLGDYYDGLLRLIELFKLKQGQSQIFFRKKKRFFLAENLGFDSIEEYVRKYNLFNRAMKLRTLSRDMRVELASAWAEILEETGHQVRFLNTKSLNILYIKWGASYTYKYV